MLASRYSNKCQTDQKGVQAPNPEQDFNKEFRSHAIADAKIELNQIECRYWITENLRNPQIDVKRSPNFRIEETNWNLWNSYQTIITDSSSCWASAMTRSKLLSLMGWSSIDKGESSSSLTDHPSLLTARRAAIWVLNVPYVKERGRELGIWAKRRRWSGGSLVGFKVRGEADDDILTASDMLVASSVVQKRPSHFNLVLCVCFVGETLAERLHQIPSRVVGFARPYF